MIIEQIVSVYSKLISTERFVQIELYAWPIEMKLMESLSFLIFFLKNHQDRQKIVAVDN